MREKLPQASNEAVLLKCQNTKGLGGKINQRFVKVGGVDLDIPKRSPVRHAPEFSGKISS